MNIDSAMGLERPQFRMGPGGEAYHWYSPGPPVTCAYEVLGANGEWRGTTLREARQWGLYPSVSTITRIEASPGLNKWIVRQAILSALTYPKADLIMDIDELVAQIERDSQEQAKQAAQRGTEIHAAIEGFLSSASPFCDTAFEPYITGACDALYALTGEADLSLWRTEVAACHPYGFGGRIDLVSEELGFVLDFKTKDFGPTDKIRAYPEQCRQLAAYREMVAPKARTANVFISRTHPGLVRVVEHNESDSAKGWREFKALLTYWQVRNGMPVLTGANL